MKSNNKNSNYIINSNLLLWLKGKTINSFTISLIFLFTTPIFATVKDNYANANKLYQEGKYEKAITIYQTIINNDNLSSDIYYNLGNCYYKQNAIPSAILNYEKALKLNPSNEDAIFNLRMANKKTIDKIERLPELFINSSWRKLVLSETLPAWSILTIILIFGALLFFISYLLSNKIFIKKMGFYLGMLFLASSLFCFVMASQHNSIDRNLVEAIIFEPTVNIQSEPSAKSEKLFTLHEGTKVRILENLDSWSKIKLPNGNVGWIGTKNIKKI